MQLKPKLYGSERGTLAELPPSSLLQTSVDFPDRAGTLPTGTVCQVESVSYSELKFNECILAGPEGARRVRRVVRATSECLYLNGGSHGAERELGSVLRIKSASFQRIDLDYSFPLTLDIVKEWFLSFLGLTL